MQQHMLDHVKNTGIMFPLEITAHCTIPAFITWHLSCIQSMSKWQHMLFLSTSSTSGPGLLSCMAYYKILFNVVMCSLYIVTFIILCSPSLAISLVLISLLSHRIFIVCHLAHYLKTPIFALRSGEQEYMRAVLMKKSSIYCHTPLLDYSFWMDASAERTDWINHYNRVLWYSDNRSQTR